MSYFLYFSLLRTDKWAETELGTKWGDKWEERFFAGIGSRQGETWHVSPVGERKYNSILFSHKILSLNYMLYVIEHSLDFVHTSVLS